MQKMLIDTDHDAGVAPGLVLPAAVIAANTGRQIAGRRVEGFLQDPGADGQVGLGVEQPHEILDTMAMPQRFVSQALVYELA